MNNKPLSKEADTHKQLILKNITPIRPIPNEYILKAMDEYSKQECIELIEWFILISGLRPRYTPEQFYEKFLEDKTREKEK